MLSRIFLAFSLIFFIGTTLAAGVPFERKSFDKARNDGGPVLLMVHADWCPTCKAQAQVIDKLAVKPEFAAFRIFRMDYDKQKGFVGAFRVSRQSALIVFKGGKEIARSLGETNEDAITTMMRKAL